jgi:two-component system KDP operon response regulator KdpE
MRDSEHDSEARIIYVLCIACTVPFLVVAIVRGEAIGAGTTIAMMIAALGMMGLVVSWRRRTRLPRARALHGAEVAVAPPEARAPPDEAAAPLDDSILIIEDEPGVRMFMHATLAATGLRIIDAASLVDGKRVLGELRPTVVLLDLALPDGDGLTLLRELRRSSRTPVIVLSARDREYDRIAALDAGADDYLLKPFDPRELRSRVDLAIGRACSTAPAGSMLEVGPFRIDESSGSVTVEGRPISLTRVELQLLVVFARQPGKVITYRELIREVWGGESVEQADEVRVHVAALRRKIERDPARPRWLVAEAGAGYRLRVAAAET